MAHQNRAQKQTVRRVMHEYKHGELKSHGRQVRNPKQAIAIGLREAGASNKLSPQRNRRNLERTKAREQRGPQGRRNKTRAELYQEAMRRNIPGRSRMNKAELEKALRRR